MIQSGYVRLLAASVAAISLHALLFTLLPAQQEFVQFKSSGSLQIELLAQQEVVEKLPNRVEKDVVKNMNSSVDEIFKPVELKKQLKADEVPQKVMMKPAPVIVASDNTSTFVAVEKEAEQGKLIETFESVKIARIKQTDNKNNNEDTVVDKLITPSTAVSRTIVIPKDIQSEIIANVHYPRQARRRGWQGEAQFLLNINGQAIQAVTMLASTGYPILDRAAKRGLSAVHHIPLSNGLYHMPVSFRLQ